MYTVRSYLFTRIIFPLLAPATATVAIIKAITIINQRYILSGVAAGAVKE